MMVLRLFTAIRVTVLVAASLIFWREGVVATTPSENDHITNSSQIPVIDISPWTFPDQFRDQDRQQVAQQVGAACRETGFFAIRQQATAPAVPRFRFQNATLLQAAWNAAQDFFNLPAHVKRQSSSDNETAYPYGYEANERLSLGKQAQEQAAQASSSSSSNTASSVQQQDVSSAEPPPPVDLKETFSLGPLNPAAGMPPRRFPVLDDDPSTTNFQTALEDYYSAMEELALILLRIFATALQLPSETWFDDKMDHHQSALRILNYYPVESNSNNDSQPVQIRAGAHTDYGVLTILKSGGAGLQVLSNKKWIDVPHLPDAFVINIGDLMQRWTCDQWVSTLHRVIVPENQEEGSRMGERRQSMAFFVNLNGDAIVEPLVSAQETTTSHGDESSNEQQKRCLEAYPPIAAGQYLMAKHLASMGVVEAAESAAENDEATTIPDHQCTEENRCSASSNDDEL